MSTPALAIVIPAYKGRWLGETLASIAAQTVREGFVVHIGDDASPDDLQAVCAPFAAQFDLRYTRFDANLGATDLVAQWQRTAALAEAPWLWLFGDDDRMPPDAVARVLAAIRELPPAAALLHFDVDVIDADGAFVRSEPRFDSRLSARAFLLGRLRLRLASYAPDYVFRRDALERIGGFVRFPRAWCSDDATWAALAAVGAEPGGLHTLPGAPIQWRSSGQNISAVHGADAADKLQALLQFVAWLRRFLVAHPARAGEPDDAALLGAVPDWFFAQLRFLRTPLRPRFAAAVRAALAGLPDRGLASRLELEWRMLRADLSLANRRRREREAARRPA